MLAIQLPVTLNISTHMSVTMSIHIRIKVSISIDVKQCIQIIVINVGLMGLLLDIQQRLAHGAGACQLRF